MSSPSAKRSPNGVTRTTARLIETDLFPCGFVSRLAEAESWRKEIFRPIYHVHKWWAKRLGSVFRATLLASVLPEHDDLSVAFYQRHDLRLLTVFDPFMGSGTTIGEAHKLGFIALGRDINPVACESVRVGLGAMDKDELMQGFAALSGSVGERIRSLYQSTDGEGNACDVLYHFWVKQVPCLHCSSPVDLFSNYVFARNAMPGRKPEVRIYCPSCSNLFPALIHEHDVTCPSCSHQFDPHHGPAAGAHATCGSCSQSFAVAVAVRKQKRPPAHRLYAKLILKNSGEKVYLRATDEDLADYAHCTSQLAASPELPLPVLRLTDGHNTRQALNYCYESWRDFFNDRQLLALGWLHQAILDLPRETVREAMLAVFSGALEFNNLFASYKGEGTGAIRHMFAHHILKPERMPIEGNLWGTPKSSGSFSGLFKTRLFRAQEYQAAPFEIALNRDAKPDVERNAYGLSEPFSGTVSLEWPPENAVPRSIHISCGSSVTTGLKDESIDLVVTDPPFFDNVHYSELADFFYAWQQLRSDSRFGVGGSTRHAEEVQDADADTFSTKLRDVLSECHRVLKNDGLLVFSYHHSRKDGWTSLAAAVSGAGFTFINAHPVRAEMSVGTPKSLAKEPIQLDSLLVCRKARFDTRSLVTPEGALLEAVERARAKMAALEQCGFVLSANDRRVAVMGQFIACISPQRGAAELSSSLDSWSDEIDRRASEVSSSPPGPAPIQSSNAATLEVPEPLFQLEQFMEHKISKPMRSRKQPVAS